MRDGKRGNFARALKLIVPMARSGHATDRATSLIPITSWKGPAGTIPQRSAIRKGSYVRQGETLAQERLTSTHRIEKSLPDGLLARHTKPLHGLPDWLLRFKSSVRYTRNQVARQPRIIDSGLRSVEHNSLRNYRGLNCGFIHPKDGVYSWHVQYIIGVRAYRAENVHIT